MKTRFTTCLAAALLAVMLTIFAVNPVHAATPTATSFSFTASTDGASLIQLQGEDTDGTALSYSIVASPSHGTISGLVASTGFLVYTPTSGYTGADSFTYKVTSGGADSNTATVSLTVTNAKTRIVDTIIDAGGNPRTGKVTFYLTQKVWSPAGLIPKETSVSGVLNESGQFDVTVYPSQALTPKAYYQVWWESRSGQREPVGVFDIPATSASSITLSPYAVTNAQLAAQYTFLSAAAINSLVTGLGSPVVSFNGRTGAISPATNDYTWAQINKTTSSLADITTRSASDLSSGTLPDARFPSTLPALNGSALTNLNASNLSSGTVAPARLGSLTDGVFPYKTSGGLADGPLLRYGSGTVGFGAGSPAAPSTSDQTTGTRLLFLSGASGEHLGMGVESGAVWSNVGAAKTYKYYWGASSAERHTVSPTEYLINTAQNSFTFNYQTSSGTPESAAMILTTNAETIRLRPLEDDTYAWDVGGVGGSSIAPVVAGVMTIGNGTKYLGGVYSNYYFFRGSTSGYTTIYSDGVTGNYNDAPARRERYVGRPRHHRHADEQNLDHAEDRERFSGYERKYDARV